MKLNDTSDLEVRVQQLEDDVVGLQDDVEDQELYLQLITDDVEDIEDDNALQNERLYNLEQNAMVTDETIKGEFCI